VLCGPCAIARWQRILDLVAISFTTGSVARQLKRAKELTPQSPHLCRSTWQPQDEAKAMWLFTPIDQWGGFPFPVQQLTPHSLSRRVRDPLVGDYCAHRAIDIDLADDHTPTTRAVVVTQSRYGRGDWQQAWSRRRDDLQRMAGIGDELAELDRRADELNRRARALLVNDQNAPDRHQGQPRPDLR